MTQPRLLAEVILFHAATWRSLISIIPTQSVLTARIFLKNWSSGHLAIYDRLSWSVLLSIYVSNGSSIGIWLRWCWHRVIWKFNEIFEEALMILTLVTYPPKFFLIVNRGWSWTLCFHVVLGALAEGTRILSYLISSIVLAPLGIFVTTVHSHEMLWVTSTEILIRIGKLACVSWLYQIAFWLLVVSVSVFLRISLHGTSLQSCRLILLNSIGL